MTYDERHKAICKVLGETYAPNMAFQIGNLATRVVDAEHKLRSLEQARKKAKRRKK